MSDLWVDRQLRLKENLSTLRNNNPHLIHHLDVMSLGIATIAEELGIKLNSDVLAGIYVGARSEYAAMIGTMEEQEGIMNEDQMTRSYNLILAALIGLMETQGEFDES